MMEAGFVIGVVRINVFEKGCLLLVMSWPGGVFQMSDIWIDGLIDPPVLDTENAEKY